MTFSPPPSRPARPVVIDLDALDDFNNGVRQARADYYGDPTLADAYAKRIAASEKQLRYRARKAAS